MLAMKKVISLFLLLGVLSSGFAFAQKGKKNEEKEDKDPMNSGTFSGMKFRSVGPALTSGRIADFAVHPENKKIYYVATASGGVWKTENSGTTFEPIGDTLSSYSMGCITMDPNNPNVLWLGTGENNNQRSVGYGSGLYRSLNAGKGWEFMGLGKSEHIGKILVDPRNSNVVYVAAIGPLWSSGGDRGVYKTTDGGKNWEAVLTIDAHTGVTDLAMDPRDPDVIYAAAFQRRRHVWTYLGGGPKSGLHKTTDGGKTWRKITSGIPGGDLGRIGLAVSPVDPDYVYAIVETQGESGGFFRSTDRGESFSKMSGKMSSGNYYQEIIADPVHRDRVYLMDTYGAVTNDGGKTWNSIGNKSRHVDDHAIWIDPNDSDYLLIGCDGGIYESWDLGENWHFKSNLPVTQFYKVAVDNDKPFYNIYGGTQDNFSLGGPSRTTSANGIRNADWYVTLGGDGFEQAIDPEDPDIVYSQYQYGGLARFDRESGQRVDIRPVPGAGEAPYRWNWDAPLFISPHKHTRLYFAANVVFRSEDRGNTWEVISGDLSRQLDRNQLKVMDKVWSMDAVAKNRSTSIYGNITALDESPLKEGLLYAGTDDGLIHVSDNGGQSWRKIDKITGVPERTYVNAIVASQHNANTAYAVFNNHKNGDFKPYIYKTQDAGRSWAPVHGDLPQRGSVYDIAEDHENPGLLFAGTEFGCFFTVNGGDKWVQLKNGLPTVAIRDLEIQRRENDLVLASFGRGFYVLDDYSPLRQVAKPMLEKEAHLFPVKDALMFIESSPLGRNKKGFQGESHFSVPNPDVGAVFTYFVKEAPKTRKDQRKEVEKDADPIQYPTFEEMRLEDNEQDPYYIFEIREGSGNVVRRLTTSAGSGVNRITWDLRAQSLEAINPNAKKPNPYSAHLVLPGDYSVMMYQMVDGNLSRLAGPVDFKAELLHNNKLEASDKAALLAFQEKVRELNRANEGARRALGELSDRVKHLRTAILKTPGADKDLLTQLEEVQNSLRSMAIQLNGDESISKREFETPPSINDRIGEVIWALWSSTSAPTTTQKTSYQSAYDALKGVLENMRDADKTLTGIEKTLEAAGAPWTPGRIPSLD